MNMGLKSYYGIIGNGETIALISPKAGIDWLCLPVFDGKLGFTKALDPINGKSADITFLKDDNELIASTCNQKYIEKTNVLETHLEFRHLHATVVDFMPWKGISEVIEDKRVIFRIIRVKNTSKKKANISVIAKSSLKSESDIAQCQDGEIFHKDEHFVLGSIVKDNENINLKPGEEKSCIVAIVYAGTTEALKKNMRKLKFSLPERELNNTITFWRNWVSRGKTPTFKNKVYETVYYRSLLLIKLLTYEKTGAILAAPTASFPATPGGSENWDYRFMWIRDSYFACRSLLKSGHTEEPRKQLEMFFRIQQKNGHWKLPFYTINGEEPGNEIIVQGLQGPHGEDNIRLNNEAKDQLQLDSEGSILHLTYIYFRLTNDSEFLRKNWNCIKKAANWITRNYSKKENGLWELREVEHKPRAHWTYGKVLCYAGLRSAIEIAEAIQASAPDEWYMTEKKLQKSIKKDAWSEQRKAFLQTFDKDAQLDISAMAIEDYGLASPFNWNMQSTVKQMEKHLVTEGNGVKRFEDASIPFFLPTLWLSMHFIRTGDIAKAKKYIDAATMGSTDLYLCAEHFDPVSGEQHGNFPQTFSAAAFIDALISIKEGTRFKFLERLNLTIKEAFRYIAEM